MRSNFMPLLGGIILVCVALYFGFQALDAVGLETRAGTASVIGKRYMPAGTSYRTEVIAGKTRTIPYARPEAYIVKLRIGGAETEAPVDRDFYQSLSNGDTVPVTYQQRRITGGLQIVSIKRP